MLAEYGLEYKLGTFWAEYGVLYYCELEWWLPDWADILFDRSFNSGSDTQLSILLLIQPFNYF